ncbi:MAG: transcription antitermination factor NusB [Flavobacteriales bacterium]|jgi:N utilization substance protein B|nr:MAG: transcription antitermination factor NusB [Flavobacteriales bacterium]
MLNRRQLRIKALEVVYAYDKSFEKNIDFQIKYFLKSNQNFFKLYITLFSLLSELYLMANEIHKKNKNKYLSNESDVSLENICKNLILKKISEDSFLSEKVNNYKIDYWESHPELLSSIWKEIYSNDLTIKYLRKKNASYDDDQSFLVNIFRNIIASNKKLYDFIEDKEISWLNDLPLVNSLILSLLKNTKKSSKKIVFMKDIYKNKDDADFGIKLIKKVIEEKTTLEKNISEITLNWDNDRIAQIDLILLQMCLTEFLYFKSIPLKVSINEYLEIAKEYSSKKSNVFINGILDKLSKKLSDEGLIKKNKRGLR